MCIRDSFYTDSNGLHMEKRKLNFREDWDLEITQPVAGNYYPITSAIYIEDAERRLTILNDRAQGGASLSPGQIEIMIHRRTLADDAKGVEEPLNELDLDGKSGLRQRVRHYLTFGKKATADGTQRRIQNEVDQPLVVFISNSTNETNKNISFVGQKSFSEPEPLLKVFMKPWNASHILYRVQNLASSPRDVPIEQSLGQERTLSGNSLMSEMMAAKLRWVDFNGTSCENANGTTIRPLEIKTYLLELNAKSD
eukprot:TRINITY_DN8740_c0_g1_i11.p1 TRINITY_DN8740_c0_g1~~TRINITY_DN8740_c0_g1_i11.p1  ORF type:complete len:253 (-),score=68.77 TRINITY_DN8740_c0_g1_i11:123-881(-)